MQQTTRAQGTLIQSVQRAAAVLKAFDRTAPELGVTELGRKVHLHKSTVSRLLATLELEGLVERVPGTEKYRLGFEFVRMAGQVTHFDDLRAAARPVLDALAESSGETINLAVLDGDEVINVEQTSGPHMVGMANWVGRRTPLHCVANGKVLLAFRPDTEIERLLAQPLARFTERTVVDPEQLRAELVRVRERGYAVALGEIEQGLNAVAAPIRAGVLGRSGKVVAAVSISGPAYRVTPARVAALAELTVAAADTIGRRTI
jgi:IclR family acetate operon transcriptional repressor